VKRLFQYFRWLYRYSEGARSALLGNILLGVATVALNLIFIWMCKSLVDIATHVRTGAIGWYTAAVLIVIGLRLICSALTMRLENITTAKMNFLIRKRIYADLLGSQWTGKEKFHSGDTLNRLMNDVDKVTQVICTEFPTMVTTLVQLVAAFVFFCLLEWRLALLLILISPAFLAFAKLFFRRMHGITKDIRDTESRIQSHIQESLQHRNVIRSLETGEIMRERLDDLQEAEYEQILDRTRFNIFSRTVIGATFSLGYIAAFLWGVYGILNGSVTFGVMTAFLQLVGQIQSPLLRLTRQIPAFVYATASIDRLAELEEAPQEEEGEPIMLEGTCGIRVEKLSFRYPDGEENIFRDFSFDFAPGSRTAIVGETGVGKSTLIRLMLALLRPVGGLIKLYNEQLEEVEISARTRRNLVYVPQGNSLFSGTIRENLLLGDPEADEARLKEVLHCAAADFVLELPDGLETLCGEQGSGLSEGQAQRIAIARALLRPGSILLLDEFSSSLDPATEERLMERLTAAAPDKTMIFITHREKIAQYCTGTLSLER